MARASAGANAATATTHAERLDDKTYGAYLETRGYGDVLTTSINHPPTPNRAPASRPVKRPNVPWVTAKAGARNIAPIESGGGVSALLYADNQPTADSIPDTTALEIVLDQAGLALDRGLLRRALAEAGDLRCA